MRIFKLKFLEATSTSANKTGSGKVMYKSYSTHKDLFGKQINRGTSNNGS